MHNWEKFRYNPWHIDCNPLPSIQTVEFDEEEVPNPPTNSRKNKWEIICGLYKNKFINYNEIEILGHKYRDVMLN